MADRKLPQYRPEQGFIILVALVLLLVLTLLGVSALDTSSLQAQMARNSLNARQLYQLSHNEIEAQYQRLHSDDGTTLRDIEHSGHHYRAADYPGITFDGPGVAIADRDILTRNATDSYIQHAHIVFAGNTAPPSGYSVNRYIGKRYEINVISTLSGTVTGSDQTQGVMGVAPL